jgi:hypothetical protein
VNRKEKDLGRMWIWLLLAALVALMVFVRVAPSEPARWHQPVAGREDRDFDGGALRAVPGDTAAFARIHAAMLALPRTQVLAGTPEEGRVTYVTRSKVMGFPDYTTVEKDGGLLLLYGRLRFGKSDMGVNRARLERVVRAAQLR